MKIGNLKVKPDNSAVPGGNGSVAETVGAGLLCRSLAFILALALKARRNADPDPGGKN